jgi:hypothetical protein
MVLLDFSTAPRKRLLSVLEDEEPAIQSLDLGSTDNTEPTKDKGHIPRELIGDWAQSGIDPFPGFDGIRAYGKKDPRIWKALNTDIRNEDYKSVVSTRPWPINSEVILEMMLKTHFDIVNLALEKTALDETHLMIAGGKSATAGNRDGDIKSEPDRASFIAPTRIYQTDENAPESMLVYCFGSLDNKGAKQRKNLIPGEIKLYYKFRRDFLDATEAPKGLVKPDYYKRAQAEQVFTQIYQYMNERHSSIGYLITDQELICVRRVPVERYGVRYGVIDISPAVPLSIARGNLNAKLALWYLHHRYGVKEPSLSVFPGTPKPPTWLSIVNVFSRARESVGKSMQYDRRPRRTTATGPSVNLEQKGDIPYTIDIAVPPGPMTKNLKTSPKKQKAATRVGKGKSK